MSNSNNNNNNRPDGGEDVDALKQRIKELEAKLAVYENGNNKKQHPEEMRDPVRVMLSHTLTDEDISRYARQLILPQFGVDGQMNVKKGKCLVVGAGGLGSPVCLYLAAAGVGHIGIVDGDHVDKGNLHRQVIHSEATVGTPKCESAKRACLLLNSSIQVTTYNELLTSDNAVEIVKQYDVVIDASDNVATRYLVNDASVLCGKPLVSGSALKMDGQLTVYHYEGGPCYRCVFPKPPPPETVTNCSEGGVIGAVPGVIGCLQALEAIKILGKLDSCKVMKQKLLIMDSAEGMFMVVGLRPRNPECAVCGDEPTVTKPINYEQFCGAPMHDKFEQKQQQQQDDEKQPLSVDVQTYSSSARTKVPHTILDVREPVQFKICALPNSVNVPLRCVVERDDMLHKAVVGLLDKKVPMYVMCRRGVDSLVVTKMLRQRGYRDVFNIQGGLLQWKKHVDPDFPMY